MLQQALCDYRAAAPAAVLLRCQQRLVWASQGLLIRELQCMDLLHAMKHASLLDRILHLHKGFQSFTMIIAALLMSGIMRGL